DQQVAFRLLVHEVGGLVCCVDSLARIQEFIKPDTPLLLVIDEANQVLESLNLGGTLKTRQAEILALFAQALKIAAANGAIVLSEARVNRRTVEQVKALSGIEQVRLIEHRAERQSWDISIATGDNSGFVREILVDLSAGKKVICHVSSRNWGRKLEKLAKAAGKTLLRIDSETNQGGAFDSFWRDPDQYLRSLPELPDLLILSPSAKSGVSITEPGFNKVYGLFSCHHPSSWVQQLARYRLPVPRRIWCPALIPASTAHEGYCSSRKVQQQLQADLAGYQRVFEIEAALDESGELAAIGAAQAQFYSDQVTSVGIEKSYARDVLIELLKQEGHNIDPDTIFVDFGSDRELKVNLKWAQEEIWREDAAAIATSDPADMTPQEARELLNSSDLTTAKRWAALKVLYRDEFPGIDFNDSADCYTALTENFGQTRRGVLLQVQAANLDAAKAAEAEQVKAVLENGIPLPHQLPRKFFRAALIERLGLLELLDGSPYQESDERVVRIKAAALHLAKEIYRYFTLSIRVSQTGIEIVNKLLRKLGLEAEVLRKVGPRGCQVKVWGLPDLCAPIRVRLLKAATERVGGNPDAILTELPHSFHDAQANSPTEPDPDPPPCWTDRVSAINDARTKAQKLDRENLQGAAALLKQISQYPGQWQATVWTLIKNLPGGWAINRAIKQWPELASEFGPLAAQTTPESISEIQTQEAVS
ncbi:MAG: hypothetical protein ACKO7W_00210, partial [Elainella sp.]